MFITKVQIIYKLARETCRQILSFGMFLGGGGGGGGDLPVYYLNEGFNASLKCFGV